MFVAVQHPMVLIEYRKLLSAPQRGPILPNNTSNLALFTEESYSFETHSSTTGIHLMIIDTLFKAFW